MKVKSDKPLERVPFLPRIINGIKNLVATAAVEPAINLFSRGLRVIVNEGTTKEPIYYTAVVTKVSRKDNVVYVAFDDGDKGWYNATRSMVGLVGLAATNRARKIPIPADQIDKWLKVPLGKIKRPTGTLADDRRKAPLKPGELTADKKLFNHVLAYGRSVNPIDVVKGKGVIIHLDDQLFKGVITRVYKDQKLVNVKLDNNVKHRLHFLRIVSFLTDEQTATEYIKPLKMKQAFELFDSGYKYIAVKEKIGNGFKGEIINGEETDNTPKGFAVDDSGENLKTNTNGKPRTGVYGQLNLDMGENKLYFVGNNIKLETKGLPAYFITPAEVKNLIEKSTKFTTIKNLMVGDSSFKVSDLNSARKFFAELIKVNQLKQPKTNAEVLAEEDKTTDVYTKWANVFKGGSKTRSGLMLSGNDIITDMGKIFKQLKRNAFAELGKYYDESGELYFLFRNNKEQDVYAVLKTNTNETWALFITPKSEYDARFGFMEVNADDFKVTEYVDLRKQQDEPMERLQRRLKSYETTDFQNLANRGTSLLLPDLPDSIKYVDNLKGGGFGIEFLFPTANDRAARNWVRAWSMRNNLEPTTILTESLEGDDRSSKWLSVTLVWRTA